jgi:hypothetical protein
MNRDGSGLRLTCLPVLLGLSLNSAAFAQEQNIEDVQRNLAIFSGILEESFDLNESTGLFGMSLGGVESTYLSHQGAVLEIRSPLANRRNRMGLASLSSAMQALQLRQNPFEAMRSRAAAPASASTQSLALAEAESAPAGIYQQLMDRIANIDYSLVAQTAMQQAAHSARSLRALGELDDVSFDDLNEQINNIRSDISASITELRQIEQEVRAQASTAVATEDSADSSLSMRLEELLQRMQPLRDQALGMAQDLKARSEQAEQDYALAWVEDLAVFEADLYQTLCEYGSTLSAIPEDQNISLILKDLGEDRGENRRTDQVHVVRKLDISACGRGEFDSDSLRERATRYSY